MYMYVHVWGCGGGDVHVVNNVERGIWQGRKTSLWEEKVKEFNGHERIGPFAGRKGNRED